MLGSARRRYSHAGTAGIAVAVVLVAAPAVIVGSGCSKHSIVDMAIASAYEPTPPKLRVDFASEPGEPRYLVLGGDFHCHVSPPDAPWDVSRGLAETIELARAEHLDFVVLTPHVPALFFADEAARAIVARDMASLRSAIDGAHTRDVLLVAGLEYTDHDWGHVGMAFADLDAVLEDVPLETAQRDPAAFIEAWVARGGTLIVNHPLVTPLPDVPLSIARADLSWRPWTRPGVEPPPEIAAIDRLAIGWEAYNLAATHLRDYTLLRDEGRTLASTLERMDREITRRRARMVPVGGSDSHSHHLRATTFVRASARTPPAIRDALVAGRVCVRDPDACDAEARVLGGPWVAIGGSIGPGARDIELRTPHGNTIFYIAGRPLYAAGPGGVLRVRVRTDRCIPIRARTGAGFSAPIYINCERGFLAALRF